MANDKNKNVLLTKRIKRWSLAMGILYAFITLLIISFYLFFWIIGLSSMNSNDLGIIFLKATPFLYHAFFASLLICIVSFLVFAHQWFPFGKDNPKKNHTIDIVLFSVLTFGFLGFVLAIPMIYFWILLLKNFRKKSNEPSLSSI